MPQFHSERKLIHYVLRVARPSAVLLEHGEDEMFRVVETVKQCLLREYKDLVAANENYPLLCTCGSDCTSQKQGNCQSIHWCTSGSFPAEVARRVVDPTHVSQGCRRQARRLVRRASTHGAEDCLGALFCMCGACTITWRTWTSRVAHCPRVLRQGTGAKTSTHCPT